MMLKPQNISVKRHITDERSSRSASRTGTWAGASSCFVTAAASGSAPSAASVRARVSAGGSPFHSTKTMAAPSTATAKNAPRQPNAATRGAATIGAMAAPKGLDADIAPLAVSRCLRVVRSLIALIEAAGKMPWSTPKRARSASIEPSPRASPQAAVNTLHPAAATSIVRLAPQLSARMPPGIWNSAYVMKNAVSTSPCSVSPRENSSPISGSATVITSRSM